MGKIYTIATIYFLSINCSFTTYWLVIFILFQMNGSRKHQKIYNDQKRDILKIHTVNLK